jgi:hypothetical protein
MKKIIPYFLIAIVLFGIYWLTVRPGQIRKQCSWEAVESSVRVTNKAEYYIDDVIQRGAVTAQIE